MNQIGRKVVEIKGEVEIFRYRSKTDLSGHLERRKIGRREVKWKGLE